MKNRDITFLAAYIIFPLLLILFVAPLLAGCSPAVIRIEEEVIEDVLEQELKGK